MKKSFVVVCFVLIILIFCSQAKTATIKSLKWFDERNYFMDLVPTPYGESPASVLKKLKKSHAVFATNGTYFGEKRNGLFSIGIVYSHGKDISEALAPARRGYVWFDLTLKITYTAPPITSIFAASGGPILIDQSRVVTKKFGNFRSSHWTKQVLRTVIAKKEHRFYVIKANGSLVGVAKLLSKYGFESAINMDGGSSSYPDARVANSLVVFKKTRPFYGDFKKKYFIILEDQFPLNRTY